LSVYLRMFVKYSFRFSIIVNRQQFVTGTHRQPDIIRVVYIKTHAKMMTSVGVKVGECVLVYLQL